MKKQESQKHNKNKNGTIKEHENHTNHNNSKDKNRTRNKHENSKNLNNIARPRTGKNRKITRITMTQQEQ